MSTRLEDQYFEAVAKLTAEQLGNLARGLSAIFGNNLLVTLRMRSDRGFWNKINEQQFCKAFRLLGVPVHQDKSTCALMGKWLVLGSS